MPDELTIKAINLLREQDPNLDEIQSMDKFIAHQGEVLLLETGRVIQNPSGSVECYITRLKPSVLFDDNQRIPSPVASPDHNETHSKSVFHNRLG